MLPRIPAIPCDFSIFKNACEFPQYMKKQAQKKAVKQRFHKIKVDVKNIINAKYDDSKEWVEDRKAYLLVRINPAKNKIELGIVNPKTHVVHMQINGKDAREIYATVAMMRLLG